MVFSLFAERDEALGLIHGAETVGEVMALVTCIVFGAAVVPAFVDVIDLSIVLYAVVSLTIVRLLSVRLALAGLGLPHREVLFIGWFGPRGLASIVFAVILHDSGLSDANPILATIVCTILLSVVLHGITSLPFISLLARKGGAGAVAQNGRRNRSGHP